MSLIALLIVTGTMFLSLFSMSMGTSMAESSGCLFSTVEGSVCAMDVSDHLTVWKDIFLAVVPSILLVIAGAVLVSAIATVPRLFVTKLRCLLSRNIMSPPRLYTYCYRPLQELFSAGILHPKLF